MKKTINLIIIVVVVWVLLLCFIFAVTGWPFSNDNEYAASSAWDGSVSIFDLYEKNYKPQIDALGQKYGLQYETVEERLDNSDEIVILYLYNDSFTIEILFANRIYYGDYKVDLYYYGDKDNLLNDDYLQKQAVGFINELTHLVAFDSKVEENENHFESLYSAANSSAQNCASYTFHFDDLVGYLGYSVGIGRDNYGYYYRMEKNSDIIIKANVFSFSGLLMGAK